MIWWLLAIAASAVGASADNAGQDVTALGPGVQYRHISDPSGPVSIHVLEVSRSQPDLRVTGSVGRAIQGKQTVGDMVATVPKEQGVPIAAVNGGFFEISKAPRFFGVPQGLSIIDGELLRCPKSTAICFDRDGRPSIRRAKADFRVSWPDGSSSAFTLNGPTADFEAGVRTGPLVLFTPRFGPSTGTSEVREFVLSAAGDGPWLPLRAGQTYRAKVAEVRRTGDAKIAPGTVVLSVSHKAEASVPAVREGDVLELRTAFDHDLSDVATAVSAEPQLLGGGKPPPTPSTSPASRAPRTLVGFNDDSLFFVVVDGRQEKLSIGMSFNEAAVFLHKLGCKEAAALDGGGSSTLWLNGRVMNSPSDGQPRAVADCLILLRQIDSASSTRPVGSAGKAGPAD